ncbi:MAG: family 20 glycosylhydrolase [Flavobacteriaceae bacterium]|nr:family 20 glycosylhydrolase [Flavobacteriaceae bacterium]
MIKRLLLLLLVGIFTQHSFSQHQLSKTLDLMPWPKEISENSEKFLITVDFTIQINYGNETKVTHAATKFLRRLSNRTGVFFKNGFPSKNNKISSLQISFSNVVAPILGVDESYTLDVKNKQILLNATTDIGAIRGLETLLQLVKNRKHTTYFAGVSITDAPRFLWRGLMIDVARHFMPVEVIKRNLDAMAAVKMNVFHWHLTDDQGFRVESKVYPKLHQLGSDGLYYTQAQIKDVVKYATRLGIRVIPEFDVPGHASAILAAYPALGSKEGYEYSIERNAGVFDPTLDPTNDETYVFLKNLFTEIAPLFPDEYFHIGGDENEGKHWSESKEITAFKKKHHLKTNHDLQTYFNIKLEKILLKLNKKLMGWDEIMTPTMPTTAVIHSWRGTHEGLKESTLIEAAKKGYQSVLSNGYYIDRMLSVKHHYGVDPIGDAVLTKQERARILGGETTMWSELVTPLTVDSRIWPRTAAIAERYWSQKSVTDVDNMFKRLNVVSFQLEELGLTHLRNKNVILRNITQNQNTNSLTILSEISEPLKIYSRNSGGTEYQTYSPFVLFADACTADAVDAFYFAKVVDRHLKNPTEKTQKKLMYFFQKWIKGYSQFQKLKSNPKLEKLRPLYSNLNAVSELFYKALKEKSRLNDSAVNSAIHELRKPIEDVAVVLINSLTKLKNTFIKKY